MSRLLVLDVLGNKGLYEADIDGLKDMYEHLHCECIDITSRRVGIGEDSDFFDIIVDDIGLFKEVVIPSALDEDLRPALVGNLIFARHDREGETVGLSDEDINLIKRYTIDVFNYDSARSWKAVAPVSYE